MHTVINYQSPYTATSLRDYMAGPALDLCACWKLTPVDADGDPLPANAVGATSHTRDLTLPGHVITFKSNGGVMPTDVDTESGQQSAGLDLDSIFTLDISEVDVAAHKWDHAVFEVYTVNYSALKMGQQIDFSGRLRQISSEGPRFRAVANPLTQVYGEVQLGRLIKHRCDVRRFADKLHENRCKLDPAATAFDGLPITVTGTVTTGASNSQFTDSSRTEPDAHFENGVVKFTSGALSGKEFEIKSFASKVFTLQLPASELIAVGTTYQAVRGCNRTPEVCSVKFGNIINYRGFPKVPGIDHLARVIRANV
ncbi:MAG: DUF2163 domain-containing protein [Acidobacteriota bacterium]|nr:DUF2163 domain-containing protein [Acidobacteriota bacterium]